MKPDAYGVMQPEPMTLKAHLVGDRDMALGDITLLENSTIEQFAQAAYRKYQGSLKRLLPWDWSIVVTDKHGTENKFPLTKWNKLVNASDKADKDREAFVMASAKSAKLYGIRK